MWKNFCADESGVTSIEYAIIASLIFMAIVNSVTL
ncbi:MAG: Flp family type IVb pilin [Deltaproteobacteria bacterium]|nr:Flp family type IVb pilin [Deltaproteobacteria bacterium]